VREEDQAGRPGLELLRTLPPAHAPPRWRLNWTRRPRALTYRALRAGFSREIVTLIVVGVVGLVSRW
jgi:hypothetical protein